MKKGLQTVPDASPLFTSFLEEMIQPDVSKRSSASKLLNHPWIKNQISPENDLILLKAVPKTIERKSDQNLEQPSSLRRNHESVQSQQHFFSEILFQ